MVEDLSLRGVVARVARLLVDCTRGHQTLVEGERGTCARLAQHPIAVMTGSVREVVQRALERDGAIRLERTPSWSWIPTRWSAGATPRRLAPGRAAPSQTEAH